MGGAEKGWGGAENGRERQEEGWGGLERGREGQGRARVGVGVINFAINNVSDLVQGYGEEGREGGNGGTRECGGMMKRKKGKGRKERKGNGEKM